MKKEITWQTKTGQVAKVEIELILEDTLDADGDKVTVPVCRMDITASVEEMGVVGTGGIVRVSGNDKGLVARIGRLGLSEDNFDRINAAIADIKATPEWQAKIKRGEMAERVDEEYHNHYNAVKKMMAE